MHELGVHSPGREALCRVSGFYRYRALSSEESCHQRARGPVEEPRRNPVVLRERKQLVERFRWKILDACKGFMAARA